MKLWLLLFSGLFSSYLFASPFFAHGDYVSKNEKGYSLALKIDRKGRIKTALPMTIPQGALVAISFRDPLYWNPETETYLTQGFFAVRMVGPGINVVCQYPVRLEASFFNYELDVTLSFSQRYFFKNGLCTREGEAETFHMFRKTN